MPSCKNASTPILTNQSDKDTNSDEKRFAANISNSQATITAGGIKPIYYVLFLTEGNLIIFYDYI